MSSSFSLLSLSISDEGVGLKSAELTIGVHLPAAVICVAHWAMQILDAPQATHTATAVASGGEPTRILHARRAKEMLAANKEKRDGKPIVVGHSPIPGSVWTPRWMNKGISFFGDTSLLDHDLAPCLRPRSLLRRSHMMAEGGKGDATCDDGPQADLFPEMDTDPSAGKMLTRDGTKLRSSGVRSAFTGSGRWRDPGSALGVLLSSLKLLWGRITAILSVRILHAPFAKEKTAAEKRNPSPNPVGIGGEDVHFLRAPCDVCSESHGSLFDLRLQAFRTVKSVLD
ncbi:hypothetical protein BDK51DRAFT_37533 [Blyttiomyces helicus]|uniref:Uncharacterized protein n=1 Tax=Blyttiomyces helicus TaxID=388810 RepID=A0A4P9WEA5_9FUNG|nr:hypothetical protein BDK51DRAFT_37533 [Blyttiomyces helicus]|eukprot:RKO89588.1 hypothetical protein BDK51DRAFT_37533 [Blyttiomyces helicus]